MELELYVKDSRMIYWFWAGDPFPYPRSGHVVDWVRVLGRHGNVMPKLHVFAKAANPNPGSSAASGGPERGIEIRMKHDLRST